MTALHFILLYAWFHSLTAVLLLNSSKAHLYICCSFLLICPLAILLIVTAVYICLLYLFLSALTSFLLQVLSWFYPRFLLSVPDITKVLL